VTRVEGVFVSNTHECAAAAQDGIEGPDKQVVPRLDDRTDVGQKQSALQKQPVVLALVIGNENQPLSSPVFLQYPFKADHLHIAEAAPEQEVFTDVGNGTEGSLVPIVVEKTQKCPFRWFSHGPYPDRKYIGNAAVWQPTAYYALMPSMSNAPGRAI
jgi:hypothetical protein